MYPFTISSEIEISERTLSVQEARSTLQRIENWLEKEFATDISVSQNLIRFKGVDATHSPIGGFKRTELQIEEKKGRTVIRFRASVDDLYFSFFFFTVLFPPVLGLIQFFFAGSITFGDVQGFFAVGLTVWVIRLLVYPLVRVFMFSFGLQKNLRIN